MTSTLFDVGVAAAGTDVFNAKMGTPDTVGCPF